MTEVPGEGSGAESLERLLAIFDVAPADAGLTRFIGTSESRGRNVVEGSQLRPGVGAPGRDQPSHYTGDLSIATAMRSHAGIGTAQAHHTVSTAAARCSPPTAGSSRRSPRMR